MSAKRPRQAKAERKEKIILGLKRRQRFRIYRWGVVVLLVGFVLWSLVFLRPHRWYTFTDQVAFAQVARDVELGYVLWEPAEPAGGGIGADEATGEPSFSSDGARMIYTAGGEDGNADLFLREWDGRDWGEARPMRALNSSFQERAPALSSDGTILYFASDRPGGRGGFDIWVSKWDGAEYAWPLPLTARVNTPYDEMDPAPSADNLTLYFASNQPRSEPGAAGSPTAPLLADEEVSRLKADFDLYAADLVGEAPFDLIVERQLSMLYSLREGALADPAVMERLGGSAETEAAVDRALAFLAGTQEEDGRWNIARHGGQGGHDVAATAFALLAYYGRGERHDEECTYRETVRKGLDWLVAVQNPASGDLRGERPQRNAMYDHGIASLALVEAYGVTKDTLLRPRAQAALDFIEEAQHDEGGWRYQPGEKGDLSVTGWMVMALASGQMSGLRVDEEVMERAARYVKSVSYGKHGGGYGYTDPRRSSPSMNAVGFFCSQLLGQSANTWKAYESSAMIKEQRFQVGDLYYAYYGTLAAYQQQGPGWREWREAMQPAFLKTQAKDGSWSFGGSHSGAMGRVIGTALVTLCLEAHYRYTPLYGLGFEPAEEGPTGESVDQSGLPTTPHYRHAKHLASLNSTADDRAPVVTAHGDFLYFSSTREGGLGGSDLYRSRISGPEPEVPRNLGEEINSAANETQPAVRHAGFHLIFNSDRNEAAGELFSARSKRVVRRYDYTNLPSGSWVMRNLGWLLALVVVLTCFGWLTRRALVAGRVSREDPALGEDPSAAPPA